LAELDVLLWGGGSLIQQSSLLYFPLHLIPAIAAARQGVEVVCFGCGVEPLRSGVLRKLVRKAFDSVFVDGFVRGPLSADLLRAYGVTTDVRVAVDQAASLAAGAPEIAEEMFALLFDGDDPVVSVSVKPSFVYRGGILPVAFDPPSPARRERRRRRTAFERSFGEFVRYLVDEIGVRVLLVPMYFGQGDLETCDRVASLAGVTGRVRVLRNAIPPRDLKSLLGLMSAHVGVRLHSCILATASGVPSVAVQYMNKHREYFAMMGMDEYLIPESEVSSDRLIATFERVWENRAVISEQLINCNAALVEELRVEVGAIFDSLEAGGRYEFH
jgi:polysaccharide pyruvyl transferase WcaK-like protein